MRKDEILNEYFEWLYQLVCGDRYSNAISYKKLLAYLHRTEFTYLLSKDKNRAADGVDLRYRFSKERYHGHVPSCLDGPCSILEMMVALAIRCEETIMDDPKIGDRTSQWFWGMVTNMGLGYMSDNRFDEHAAKEIIDRFLNRDYSQNGRGGLFTVRNCEYDLTNIEIWTQMLWFLDSISS